MAFTRKARKALRVKRSGKTNIADPYYQGDEAAHAGLPETANPHPPGSEEHTDWQQGYREAHPSAKRWI